jgi:hypothetical protein
MERAGLQPEKIRAVRGFADTRPRVADPLDSRNRRVSIVVQSLDLEGLPDTEIAPPMAPEVPPR